MGTTYLNTGCAVNVPSARRGRSDHGFRRYPPYLLIELLLPGGTVIALLLWLFRRKFDAHAQVEQGVAAPARQ